MLNKRLEIVEATDGWWRTCFAEYMHNEEFRAHFRGQKIGRVMQASGAQGVYSAEDQDPNMQVTELEIATLLRDCVTFVDMPPLRTNQVFEGLAREINEALDRAEVCHMLNYLNTGERNINTGDAVTRRNDSLGSFGYEKEVEEWQGIARFKRDLEPLDSGLNVPNSTSASQPRRYACDNAFQLLKLRVVGKSFYVLRSKISSDIGQLSKLYPAREEDC